MPTGISAGCPSFSKLVKKNIVRSGKITIEKK
jgi:hypothetical protein